MKCNIFIVLFASVTSLIATVNNIAPDIRLSIITDSNRIYKTNQVALLNYNEDVILRLEWLDIDRDPVHPIGAFVERVNFDFIINEEIVHVEIPLAESLYTTVYPLQVDFRFNVRSIVEDAQGSDSVYLTPQEINDLTISMTAVWRKSRSPGNMFWLEAIESRYTPQVIAQGRSDRFTLKTYKSGWSILIDLSALQVEKGRFKVSFLSFMHESLLYSDLGLSRAYDSEFKMIADAFVSTTPIIRHYGRDWASRNTVLDFIIVTDDVEKKTDEYGYGPAVGILGRNGAVKLGVYWIKESKPYYVIGFSFRDLSDFMKKL